jgi:DNA-binding NarL/FixJ family response regulator
MINKQKFEEAFSRLTPKQAEVYQRLALTGESQSEMAAYFGVSRRTISCHLEVIYRVMFDSPLDRSARKAIATYWRNRVFRNG